MIKEVLVKKEAETDWSFGKKPEERSVSELIEFGVVNLDKPSGPTSHQASDYVQRILEIKKAGHGGSLDPRVTGVLPVTLEKATRLSSVFLKGGKEYVCVMHLHKEVDSGVVRKTIKDFFVGKIRQTPPLKSAVKRVEREREVYTFDILEIDGKDVLFKISCEAGTYIRKICHDLGLKLKVGANMAELRRVRAASFTEEGLVTLQDLKDAFVLFKEGNEKFIRYCVKPAERMVQHLPKVFVFDSAVESLCHGRELAVPGVSKLNEFAADSLIAIMTLKDELVALGVAWMGSEEIMKKEKGIAVKTEKVFMEPGIYLVK